MWVVFLSGSFIIFVILLLLHIAVFCWFSFLNNIYCTNISSLTYSIVNRLRVVIGIGLCKEHPCTSFAVYMYSFYWIINSGVELLINKVRVFSTSVDSASVKNGCTKYTAMNRVVFHGSRLVSALGIVSLLNFNPFL